MNKYKRKAAAHKKTVLHNLDKAFKGGEKARMIGVELKDNPYGDPAKHRHRL